MPAAGATSCVGVRVWDWLLPVGCMIAAAEAVAAVVIWTRALLPQPAGSSLAPTRTAGVTAEGAKMRCWWCGASPDFVVQTFGSADVVPRWSGGGDHEHSVEPPTPEQLLDRGYRSMLRTTEILME